MAAATARSRPETVRSWFSDMQQRRRSASGTATLLIFSAVLSVAVLSSSPPQVAAEGCRSGCDLALGSFYVSKGLDLTKIAGVFGLKAGDLLPYSGATNGGSSIVAGARVGVPFSCNCLEGPQGATSFLGSVFPYTVLRYDTYDTIASTTFANLTTSDWLQKTNSYPPTRIPDGGTVNVTVNCSCGDASVSKSYGLFETYPLREGDSLKSVAAAFGISSQDDLNLLSKYNPGVDFDAGAGIVFVPTKDSSGNYRPLPTRKGVSGGVIAGICIGVIAALLLLAVGVYCGVYRRRKTREASLLRSSLEENAIVHARSPSTSSDKSKVTTIQAGSAGSLPGFSVDKSVEFSYEELAKATNGFSMTNKIGEGGFGAVFYAELRGERAAIKKMDMQATREFLAELKVLTHVHHLNLVRLIGYCTEVSLFLVYEFIDNGNLSQHLHGSGSQPLPWYARVKIALDSARGLEYIHEHTVPVYIHRDIKTANILIDKNFRGKVADFGLAKLTEVGSSSLQTRLVGTFGYMPPEYAQYGDVSPKVDVYAFGVVLYELISAKEAIIKSGAMTEMQGLVALFEDALNHPDPKEELKKLVDSRLAGDYPIEAVYKMAHLAKACTQENPQLRPSMRSIVVALMTLSSSTEDWDIASLYGNQALVNLMSGR